MPSGPDPLFSAETTRAILQRAAELQGTMDAAPAGLTLSEVQAAGAAAGLSPEAVRRAALEVAGGAKSSGMDGRMRQETRLIPAPATDAAWEAIQQELRWMTGGQAEERGAGSYDWAWRPAGYEFARVRLDPVEGGTRLTVRQMADAGNGGVTFLMGVIGVCLGIFLLLTDLPLPYVLMAALLLTLAGIGASFPLRRRLKRREETKSAALADRLAGLVASHAPPEVLPAPAVALPAAAPAVPALTLPDADPAPVAAALPRRNGPLHG